MISNFGRAESGLVLSIGCTKSNLIIIVIICSPICCLSSCSVLEMEKDLGFDSVYTLFNALYYRSLVCLEWDMSQEKTKSLSGIAITLFWDNFKTICDAHQDFGDRAHWLLFFGYDPNVEDSREDEDETGGRCGTWEADKKTHTHPQNYSWT